MSATCHIAMNPITGPNSLGCTTAEGTESAKLASCASALSHCECRTHMHSHVQVPHQVGRVLECSESVGLDRASASHSSTGARQVLRRCSEQLAALLSWTRCTTDAYVIKKWALLVGMFTKMVANRLETTFLGMHGCTRALRRSGLLCCGLQQQAAQCNDKSDCGVTGMDVVQTLAPATQLGPLGYLAGASFLVGFVWETMADLQKFHFKSQNPDKCAP